MGREVLEEEREEGWKEFALIDRVSKKNCKILTYRLLDKVIYRGAPFLKSEHWLEELFSVWEQGEDGAGDGDSGGRGTIRLPQEHCQQQKQQYSTVQGSG